MTSCIASTDAVKPFTFTYPGDVPPKTTGPDGNLVLSTGMDIES